jgi:hypothetical protein
VIRGQAYQVLMQVVGTRLGDWDLAAELHRDWGDLRPCDTDVSSWAPTIENRRRGL